MNSKEIIDEILAKKAKQRKNVTLRIEAEVWDDFASLCKTKKVMPGEVVEKLLKSFLES